MDGNRRKTASNETIPSELKLCKIISQYRFDRFIRLMDITNIDVIIYN